MNIRETMAKFCGDNGLHPCFMQPFVQGGFFYACDTRIALSIPAPGEPDTLPLEGVFPNMTMIYGPRDWEHQDWQPWPTEPLVPAPEPCPDCRGAGKTTCGSCGSKVDCLACGGAGYTSAQIGKRLIAGKYKHLIDANLTGVKWSDEGEELTPMMFIFDGGGRGLLMPMGRVD